MARLADERCEACTAETPTLRADDAEAMLRSLAPGWRIDEGTRLTRRLTFRSFRAAFEHAARIAEIADAEGHHPDLCVGWGYLSISLTTHAIGGLSRNDFVLAAKMDALTDVPGQTDAC